MQKIVEHFDCRNTAENRWAFRLQRHRRKSSGIPPAGTMQKILEHFDCRNTAENRWVFRLQRHRRKSSGIPPAGNCRKSSGSQIPDFTPYSKRASEKAIHCRRNEKTPGTSTMVTEFLRRAAARTPAGINILCVYEPMIFHMIMLQERAVFYRCLTACNLCMASVQNRQQRLPEHSHTSSLAAEKEVSPFKPVTPSTQTLQVPDYLRPTDSQRSH